MKTYVRILLLMATILSLKTTRAQMVTIPDTTFLTFLQNSSVAACLSGNQLDASCPAVLNKHTLDCHGFNINDLTGLQAFVNLDTLYCYSNGLDSLPSLPSGLIYLECGNNQLTSLPSLPAGLAFFACEDNQLTSLPSLPSGLTNFFCSFNPLTSLPNLPAGLTYLECIDNQLASLPALPAALTDLACYGNQLTSLPSLPTGLTQLTCYGNQLTSLPSLPAGLTSINCSSNQINLLPILPLGLATLYCSGNALTSMPALPAGLTHLTCGGNQLTLLPSLPAGLNDLDCSGNQLSSLPNLPTSLEWLGCGNNPLDSLPNLPAGLTDLTCEASQLTSLPSLPAGLILLNCSHNQLTNLPFSGPLVELTFLNCSNNQLSYLPALPSVMENLDISNNPGINCLPPITQLTGFDDESSIGGTGITCLSNIIQHNGSIPSIDTLPLCGILNPSGCDVAWNISGTVYRDDNSNCSLDSLEARVPNIKLLLSQAGVLLQQVYSNTDGRFSFYTGLGTFQATVDTSELPFYVWCPNTGLHTSTLISGDSLDYNANFALQCKSGYDVAVQSLCQSSGIFFPGHHVTVSIQAGDLAQYYGMTCNTAGLSGTVTATCSGPASVSSVSGNGVVSGNTVTWNVSDFSQLNFFGDLSITFLVDTVPATNQMCLTVTVNPSSGTDYNLNNNTLTQCFQVVNSFDPNVKEVFPQHVDSASEWLTYTIRFQNTGTAPAENILVIDPLSPYLDWSTFQLLAYSHHNLTQVLPNGVVHFNFPNINLPDSTSDEPNSHGWVQYKIKTKSTVDPATTVIHNTASIYFDFNTPVVTNDAAISPATGIATVPQFDFALSPNPTMQNVLVTLPVAQAHATVTVTDLTGRAMLIQTLNDKSQTELSLNGLAAGTYFVQLSTAGKTFAVKKLVLMR